MQIDIFPTFGNQKVGAMIMAIAATRHQLNKVSMQESTVDDFNNTTF